MKKTLEHLLFHEFNTPMNGIFGLTECLEQKAQQRNDNELLELCEQLKASASRLCNTFSKLAILIQCANDASTAIKNVAQVDICQTLQTASTQISIKHNRQDDLVLNCKVRSFLRANKNFFQAVLCEIIDNAFKFSQPGKKVTISADATWDKIKIRIADEGKSANAKWLSDSLEPYRQYNRELHEQQGLGVGLALAHAIINSYKGTITFEDNQPSGIVVNIVFVL